MIIVRSPLRISLGGGGTDLESYYGKHEGFLLSAAIDKYVYVNVSTPFDDLIKLKYSEYEEHTAISDIKHPIIKTALEMIGIKKSSIEITTTADLPSGTGLGSSGSFTTALIKALYANQKMQINMRDLAEMACDIEINKLGAPIGKQDQYIASYGGIKEFTISQDGVVGVNKCNMSSTGIDNLEDSLMLFFTGYSRNANNILSEQDNASKNHDTNMINNLHKVKELGLRSKIALENNNILEFGKIMNEHWLYKKQRSSKMSNEKINVCYEHALENGAIGGKLVGAGAGGFLLFVTQDKALLRKAMENSNLTEVKIRFDFEGTKFVMVD